MTDMLVLSLSLVTLTMLAQRVCTSGSTTFVPATEVVIKSNDLILHLGGVVA